jgi:hypothetical protein
MTSKLHVTNFLPYFSLSMYLFRERTAYFVMLLTEIKNLRNPTIVFYRHEVVFLEDYSLMDYCAL